MELSHQPWTVPLLTSRGERNDSWVNYYYLGVFCHMKFNLFSLLSSLCSRGYTSQSSHPQFLRFQTEQPMITEFKES